MTEQSKTCTELMSKYLKSQIQNVRDSAQGAGAREEGDSVKQLWILDLIAGF
jgi:hypothetical protein